MWSGVGQCAAPTGSGARASGSVGTEVTPLLRQEVGKRRQTQATREEGREGEREGKREKEGEGTTDRDGGRESDAGPAGLRRRRRSREGGERESNLEAVMDDRG